MLRSTNKKIRNVVNMYKFLQIIASVLIIISCAEDQNSQRVLSGQGTVEATDSGSPMENSSGMIDSSTTMNTDSMNPNSISPDSMNSNSMN